MLGIADPADPADPADAADRADPADPAVLALVDAPFALFEDSEWPGATEDTSAANPAVNAAAPAITQRLVRLTRTSAASRIIAARDRSTRED